MANNIHPTAVIGDQVILGNGNYIGPYSVIYGPTTMGDNNWIGPHVVIGTPGQDTRNRHYDSSESRIVIGNNNIIREFTAIQKPCYRGVTSVGNNVFLMQSVHIPHDAILEDDVVVTPMVVLAGITRIMQGANLGIGCAIHQYCVVGPYSIVGMGASLTKSLKPFSKFVPGKPLAVNSYAVDRYGFSDVRDEIENYLVNGISPTSGRLLEIVKRFESATSVSDRMVL